MSTKSDAAPSPQIPQAQIQGAEMSFSAGSRIFSEGDPGGDLFFIKEGFIEIFKTLEDLDVKLAVLGPGEVVGIMTCLTRDPRLASARAATDVKALVVKQAGFRTLISATPVWVNTVIKDFVVRIRSIDGLYSQAVKELHALKRDGSLSALAGKLAGGLAEIGAVLANSDTDTAIVDLDQALAHLAVIHDCPPSKLTGLFELFLEVGLFRGSPKAARKAELGAVKRLTNVAAFVRSYQHDAGFKAAMIRLEDGDIATLSAFAEAAVKLGSDALSEARLPVQKLREAAGLSASEAVEAALVKRAEGARAAAFDRQGGGLIAIFTPATLSTQMRTLAMLRKLELQEPLVPVEVKDQKVQVITENF
jgi:CRP-like cAMP-binding protein